MRQISETISEWKSKKEKMLRGMFREEEWRGESQMK